MLFIHTHLEYFDYYLVAKCNFYFHLNLFSRLFSWQKAAAYTNLLLPPRFHLLQRFLQFHHSSLPYSLCQQDGGVRVVLPYLLCQNRSFLKLNWAHRHTFSPSKFALCQLLLPNLSHDCCCQKEGSQKRLFPLDEIHLKVYPIHFRKFLQFLCQFKIRAQSFESCWFEACYFLNFYAFFPHLGSTRGQEDLSLQLEAIKFDCSTICLTKLQPLYHYFVKLNELYQAFPTFYCQKWTYSY